MSLRTVQPQAKYGLITKKPNPSSKKTSIVDRKLKCFDECDEEEEISSDPRVQVNRQLRERNEIVDKSVEKVHAAALSADASIFDYDGSYDTFKSKEVESHPLSKGSATPVSRKKPPFFMLYALQCVSQAAKYVNNLFATAKVREKERDRIYERFVAYYYFLKMHNLNLFFTRNLLKERKKEDEQFGDAPKFLTTAYKKKLTEDRKWEYEDRLAEEIEQRTDVRQRGMQGFYSNLLTKNVALGGDIATSAVSAYTAGSQRQQMLDGTLPISSITNNNNEIVESISADNIHSNEVGDDNNAESNVIKKRKLSESEDIHPISTMNDVIGVIKDVKDVERIQADASVLNESNQENPKRDVEIKPSKEEIVMSARERYLARKKGT